MSIRTLSSIGLFLALAGCRTPTTPEQQFLDDAMAAIGGRARIAAAKTLVIDGEGVNYNLGQDMKPEAATQRFTVTGYKRQIDLANGRQRIEQTRTPNFAFFQGPQAQVQVLALDGDIAFNTGASGQGTRLAAGAENDRRHELYHHPLTLLHAATDAKTTLSNVRSAGAARQAEIKTAAGPVLTMTIDAGGRPLSISSKTAHPNLGDVTMITTFGDYKEVNGLQLPAQFSMMVDEFTTAEIHAASQAVDAALTDLAAPDAVRTRPAAAAPNVVATSIGKGVWLLAGQSHHSVLVEFVDHLMLIEAPQSEARTLAVIATAKTLVPNKPLTQLVTTHHHFDHTAGLRAAIAEGMTVITHAGNREWVERMAKRPHTIQPDTLAKNATRLEIETVDAEKEVKDQSMTVMLYHVADNPHSDTMLMAYIPRDRLVVEVDAFAPGSTVYPYAANLLENIQKRNLRVDRIVPLHGTIAPFAELVKITGGK